MTPTARRLPWCAAALLVATLLLYAPVRHFQFINYDDDFWIYANPHLQAGLSAETVRWAFTSFYAANYVPLTWLSLAAQAGAWGTSAAGFHLVNAALHAVTAVLLLALLWKATARLPEAAVVAALFAVHPLRVESVAWASEHKDVLCSTFFLATLLAYTFYVRGTPGSSEYCRDRLGDDRSIAARASAGGWYAATIVLSALALLAKPMAVTLPMVLLLLDMWPLRRCLRSRLVVEKLPLVLLAAAAAWTTVLAQRAGQALQPLARVNLSVRLQNAVVSVARYLKHFVWPTGLSVFYPYPAHWPTWTVLLAAGLCALITVLAILNARAQPYLLVGWLWFIGMLVPVIGLVQVGLQSMADRYSYLPSIGLTFAAVWAVGDWARARPGRARPALVAAAMVAVVFAGVTAHQLQFWIDTPTLFNHALDVTTGNDIAHLQLGLWEAAHDRLDRARTHYEASLAIAPENVYTRFNYGNLLMRQGDFASAAAEFQVAAQHEPRDPRLWGNLGIARVKSGQPQRAGDAFARAVAADPASTEARENLRKWRTAYTRGGKPALNSLNP